MVSSERKNEKREGDASFVETSNLLELKNAKANPSLTPNRKTTKGRRETYLFGREVGVTERIQLVADLSPSLLDLLVLLPQLPVSIVDGRSSSSRDLGTRSGVLVLVDLSEGLGGLLILELEDSGGEEGFGVESSATEDVVEVVLREGGDEEGKRETRVSFRRQERKTDRRRGGPKSKTRLVSLQPSTQLEPQNENTKGEYSHPKSSA